MKSIKVKPSPRTGPEPELAATNPYYQFVEDIEQSIQRGKSLSLGSVAPLKPPGRLTHADPILVFSPHPDDECIVGGLALRLLRETRMPVVNVAVTLGSKVARRKERWRELAAACKFLGFRLVPAAPGGLERITPQARQNEPEHWARCVEAIAALLTRKKPLAVFLPHEGDWNGTHVGTHYLVMDALRKMPSSFQTLLIETEFWAAMASPNLMVELGDEEVADLVGALSFHVGEVERNPYHLRLPAWMQDNVRRGAELVGGQGGAAPDFTFATLYRVRQWRRGAVSDFQTGGKSIGRRDFAGAAIGLSH